MWNNFRNHVRVASLVLLVVGLSAAQESHSRFEVASVRRSASDEDAALSENPGTYQIHGVPLRILIESAYRVRSFQVVGAPSWYNDEGYTIIAKIPDGARKEDVPQMLQALLEERFHLKIHRETRMLPVHTLSAAKGGARLPAPTCDPTTVASTSTPAKAPCGSIRMFRQGWIESFTGRRIAISDLVRSIEYVTQRIVVDKIGVDSKFDIDLEFEREGAPAAAEGAAAPTLAMALEEKLGLKLETSRGPVEVLAIDHVERPSEN